jgi:hypothetical protein
VIREHFAAVKVHLEGDVDLAGKGHDSARRDNIGALIRDTYWILFGGSPDELDDNRFTKAQDINSTAEFVYTIRSVSVTADGARAEADKIAVRLVGVKLTVAGRRLDAIRLTSGGEVRPDESVRPPLYFCDDEYTLVSRRS